MARPEFDRGAAPSNLALDRMLLVLRRNPKQESALSSYLSQLQDKSSPNFHAWLTPDEFGRQYGPSKQDIQSITSWLASHGLKVNSVAKSRGFIEFSGTAGQVKEAFQTEIHNYVVAGEEHWANSSDPQIPTLLAPVIAGIVSLNNFPRKPFHRVLGSFSKSTNGRGDELHPRAEQNPLHTAGGGCGIDASPCYSLMPYDFATIYNVLPLWNASSPIDGTGQTIAIVGQSDVFPPDFSNFRLQLGLPPGTLNIIYNGVPPIRMVSQGDELESDLDIEWSGGVAKGATIDLVASSSTNATAGVDLSALYIVDNNVAPILSESYGACELEMGTAGNLFYNQLWQQAAAEGITVFVSTGDSGSASCDQNMAIATHGLTVSGVSSTPYNIAVGGTDFDDSQNLASYWNSTNDPTTQASAKGYIPESSWNDSCTNSEQFVLTGDTTPEGQCNDSRYWPGSLLPVGGSGGASNCTTSTGQSLSTCGGGYSKPSWQTGLGVPNDGSRDVPDVSLFAGDGLNSSFYAVCETDMYGGCAPPQDPAWVAVGGTSAAAPTFAGIMALINQKTQSRQGNANYIFYTLAAQPGASCDSSAKPAGSCIFNDITTGTIAMPCPTGSPNCVTNISGDVNGILSGYNTTMGYDLATGLGSVNVENLVNNWETVTFRPTTSTLSLSPTTSITHGTAVNVDISVAPTSGTGTPSGLASLLTSKGRLAGTFTVANGSVSGMTALLPGGNYTVTAHYAGDGTFGASDSAPGIPVTVTPEPSTITVQAFTLDAKGNPTPFTGGQYGHDSVYVNASVAGTSGQGIATGSVNLTQMVNGTTTNMPGDPYALNSEGNVLASQVSGYFPVGAYSIAGTYGGDASFKASSSPAVSFTITKALTTTTTSVSPCSPGNGVCVYPAGSSFSIFSSVASPTTAFIAQPTGTITFYSNGAPLGPPVAVDTGEVPPFAAITVSQLLGSNSITTQYNGDSNYSPSTSTATLVEVGETFTMGVSPSTMNVSSPGQSGTTTLTFAPQNGFTGSTTLNSSMCSNLPTQSRCSFSPAVVSFTSSTASVPVTLTITTTGPSSRSAAKSSSRSFAMLGISSVFASVLLFGFDHRRRKPPATMVFIAFAVIACATACGGSGGGGGGGGGNPGTPAGTYYGVTVTATINGITQTINNLTVVVQ
ncbi:MAG TPA: protease pro-enzyme activation domain-containing protein [Candidatus Binatia bacterium]|nr:protease pro-enzyme activation domain-containing protein [Candidatus Binatia bacterium]